jgi:hypothetical protein
MSVTHANKTESTQEPHGVKTMGEAAAQFVDNRATAKNNSTHGAGRGIAIESNSTNGVACRYR